MNCAEYNLTYSSDPLAEVTLREKDPDCWEDWSLEDWWMILVDMLSLLFWGILNPEMPETFDTSRTDGVFAVVIFGLYAILGE